MKEKIALLIGASGSVGFEVLQTLLRHPAFSKVIFFVRKPLDESKFNSSGKLIQKIISEMTPATLSKSVRDALGDFSSSDQEIVGFSALGIGAGTAKLTIDQHRAVDVELNQAFAQALREDSRVKYFALLSAMGSNPKARTTGSGAAGMPRFARVKGEMEEAVKLHGPKAVGIFLPAIIRGSQHTPKIIEAIGPLFDYVIPAKYHSITTQQLAQAMVAASLASQPSSAVYSYPEMLRLIQS